MKKIGFILIIAMIALASCSKGDKANPLVGTWELSTIESGSIILVEVTFKADNTGNVIAKLDGVLFDSFPFTWSTNNNMLTTTMDGETDTQAYSISGNKLTVGGEVYTRK